MSNGHPQQGSQLESNIEVTRSSAKRDYRRTFAIHVDGIKVFELAENVTRHLRVTSGRHEVQISIDWERSSIYAVDVAPGETEHIYCKSADDILMIRRIMHPHSKAIYVRSHPWGTDEVLAPRQVTRGHIALALIGAFLIFVLGIPMYLALGIPDAVGATLVAASVVFWTGLCVMTDRPLNWVETHILKSGREL